MRDAQSFKLALVTAPDLKTARRLAKKALEARLVACVNLVPGIESHYWWKNNIESGREVLLILKTKAAQVSALEKMILANHPYDTAEFIVVDLAGGTPRYLDWWSDSVTKKQK